MDSLPSEIIVQDTDAYRADWWALSLVRARRGEPLPAPEMVVKPRDTAEVAAVVEWAANNRLSVVPRGGGSGVCGASQPSERSLVLDMTSMDRILELDETSMVCHAQCGIGGPALEEALSAKRLMLGHIPQSFHLSTLGGWIGTKAIGQLSTKYGGIEDRLLGLEAVLSDGTVIASRPSPRSSTGPDWWRLFAGSEGTLGVVTSAWLSLFSVPDSEQWLAAEVESFESGLGLVRRLIRDGLRPSVARLYDPADAAVSFGSIGLGSRPVVILRFEGSADMVKAEVASAVAHIIAPEKILDSAAGEHWWERRFRAVEIYRDILAGTGPLGPYGIVDTMEVAGFWASLPRLYEAVRNDLSANADAVLAHSSHFYQSGANIYFTFLISSAGDEAEAESRYHRAWNAGMRATLSAGGTISHHHGIGLLKSPWMADEHGSGLEALRLLKRALDPSSLMNPGKLGL